MLDEEILELKKIIDSTEYFTPVNKSQIPHTMEPVVNVVIPDIFNHNNGEPIHCNAIVCGLKAMTNPLKIPLKNTLRPAVLIVWSLAL